MTALFTPGPWLFDPEINRVYSVPTNLCIATPHLRGNEEADKAWPADARLIAAAPEMFQALKAVEGWWLEIGMKDAIGAPYAMFAARAALAKIEG